MNHAEKARIIHERVMRRKIEFWTQAEKDEFEYEMKLHLQEQEAIIRARKNGLSLSWLSGWDHLHLDDISPDAPPHEPSTARVITLATDYQPESGKNSMGFHGLKVSLRENNNTSPGWENGVRAMEDKDE